MQNMSVLEYYKGKIIMITGTSGFLGKVILEKVLRTIPDVQKIFLLIRNKSGESSQVRFQKNILNSPLFERLKKRLG